MAFIFGKSLVTPAMKKLMVYSGHYIDQAKKDAELLCSLAPFSDSLMEGAES